MGLLMASDLIRPHVAVHALVTACSRGFVEVVDTLLKVHFGYTYTNLYRKHISVI